MISLMLLCVTFGRGGGGGGGRFQKEHSLAELEIHGNAKIFRWHWL